MYYNTKVDKYWIITQKTKKHLRFFETTSNNLHSKCVSKTSKKNIKKTTTTTTTKIVRNKQNETTLYLWIMLDSTNFAY